MNQGPQRRLMVRYGVLVLVVASLSVLAVGLAYLVHGLHDHPDQFAFTAPLLMLVTVGLALVSLLYMRDASREKSDAVRAERLSAGVFEASPEAIAVIDAKHRIVSVNPAFANITGHAEEEAVGSTTLLLGLEEDNPSLEENLWRELAHKGTWQGEIVNRRKDGESYPQWLTLSCVRDERGAISHFIAIFSDITERKAREERIRYLAEHDFLTGLPNRALFQDRVGQAINLAQRQSVKLSVLFIDLDRFKLVNDTIGHHVGDLLLKEVAGRIKSCVRASDSVSRQGGDEFLILLTQIDVPEDAAHVAEKLLERISEPYQLAGHEVAITPSIGISIYPDDGADLTTLIKAADTAMYHGKRQGRNRFHFFTPTMQESAIERLALERCLRHALDLNEFRLVYQPVMEIDSRRIVGVEALLRWNSAELGAVEPGKFIPVAEESGLILQIGEWVLREACRQARVWANAGVPQLTVAVNVSALQFAQANFVETVRQVLHETGLNGRQLELEVTESLLMTGVHDVMQTFAALRKMGVSLSIDDFGTGYSSLSYLYKLPIDKLKIDRSFVRDVLTDPGDATITALIIHMTHSIGLRVLAEGVETREQLEFLRIRDCDQMQGYLVSKPLSPEDLVEFLKTHEASIAARLEPAIGRSRLGLRGNP